MTIEDLRKRIASTTDKDPLVKLMERCHNLSFQEFWHFAPPISNITGKPSPLHDFQLDVINNLDKYRRIAVLKTRGAGLSTIGHLPGHMVSIGKTKTRSLLIHYWHSSHTRYGHVPKCQKSINSPDKWGICRFRQ